jgi:hypothetical protein
LLKYYAISCLENRHKQLGLSKHVLPIFLPLRELQFEGSRPILLWENLARRPKTALLNITARDFRYWIQNRAGLIADYGEDHYIFRHKSFREFLTGAQLLKEGHDEERLKTLVENFKQPWWEEVLRFFMSSADDKIFDRFMRLFFRSEVSRSPEGATPEGLMDMAGNVWEWMANWYDDGEKYRALRGGSWFYVESRPPLFRPRRRRPSCRVHLRRVSCCAVPVVGSPLILCYSVPLRLWTRRRLQSRRRMTFCE